ncbi:MAG: purine-binding chemotaxis protein CheW [Acidobacteria bacterium]|nr:purine-binding chemotaxis protein CheW [Acidobacteriota bacterium]
MNPVAAEPSVGAARQGPREQVLAFGLGDRSFGIPLAQVAEIQPFQTLRRMPHMPRGVEGLLDLRGQVIPVVNLRTRLGFPPREDTAGSVVLVVEVASLRTGLLVDAVHGVIRRSQGQLVPPSRILDGPDGGWVTGFLVLGDRILSLLDPVRAASPAKQLGRSSVRVETLDLETRLDEDLQRLLAMAPPRAEGGGRIIPQIETAISHTEEEMAKVLERVEGMLENTDQLYMSLGRLKQEAAMGHLKGEEVRVAELDKLATLIQEEVFRTLQLCQFQDIARQKLERVLRHIQGLQGLVGKRLREE